MQKIFFVLPLLVWACSQEPNPQNQSPVVQHIKPYVAENGRVIHFSQNPKMFDYYIAKSARIEGKVEAPAKVAASILRSATEFSNTIILFENPELTELYTSYLQSIAHLARDEEFYKRVLDMYANNAATGKELIEARTGKIEASTELAEKEARLRVYGFPPEELKRAKQGTVWLIANVAEADLSSIQTGKKCQIDFISFAGESYEGLVDDIGEVLDDVTRTFNVRIVLQNKGEKFRPGMFAKVRFEVVSDNALFVPNSALFTAEGKTYIFKRINTSFFRTEVVADKNIEDFTIIKEGLHENDTVVIKGTMLLKGLSFGY